MTDCCYLCSECNVSFSSLLELEGHILSHGIKDEERMSADEDSSQHSPSSSEMSGELAMKEDGEHPNACKFCPSFFDDRAELSSHLSSTHSDRTLYRCAQCPEVFAIKRELATHSRVHSGESPHECAQCGKQFGTRQLLKKHCMWHTGERSHVCPHCNKAFFQKGHLTQHLMIHAGGRPHVCSLCNKTFIFKFDLNRHMKIHAERGHSCIRCRRSFLKQTSLDEHMLRCKGGSISSLSSPSTPTGKDLSPSLFSFSAHKERLDKFPSMVPPSPQCAQTCLLCSRSFPSTAELAVHLSVVHLPAFNSAKMEMEEKQSQVQPLPLPVPAQPMEEGEIANPEKISAFLPIKTEEILGTDTATNSSCASSPQKPSPPMDSSSSPSPQGDNHEPSPISFPPPKCTSCDENSNRIAQLEAALSNTTRQLNAAQTLLRTALRLPSSEVAPSLPPSFSLSSLSPSLFSSIAALNRSPSLAPFLNNNLQSLLVNLQ